VTGEADAEKRAPGPLRVVQDFVNSADLERGEDELGSPEALAGWLREHGLAPPGTAVSAAEHRRAIDVREGLRAVLFAHNGGDADPQAVERLERAAARAELRACFPADGGPKLTPSAGGASGALAQVLVIVTTAAADGTWGRLKACADSGCRWAFYDHTKNRSGRWCTMAVCGNQQKARTYRARRRRPATT
jgi:predicted RNA-binding Zn ribbon-like protein